MTSIYPPVVDTSDVAPTGYRARFRRGNFLLIATILTIAVSQSAFVGVGRAQSAKISAGAAKAMAGGGLDRLIVVLADQADVSGAAHLATKAEKTRYVYERLQAAAARSQPALMNAVSQMGLTPATRLYIENALIVTAGSGKKIASSAVNSLAARSDIARILADDKVAIDPLERPVPAASAPQGIAWNVAWINAPDVWAAGFIGQGIVVGDVDTGVQWNHPALIQQYRGWNGSTANHNYNWWDPTEEASPVPIDTNGHGTSTTGTAVGFDGANSHIGVAPGAKWIACRALGPGASASTVLTCLQFMLAPWDLNGNNPDPSKAPDVINNSYICPFCGLEPAFDNLHAAGIFSVGVTGNLGPSCGSVFDPGNFPSVFATGALSFQANTIADFSSRGPGLQAFNVPEIVAPGTDVVSSVPTDSYGTTSGTSIAAPAVTGAVALLWSAQPGLIGKVAASIVSLESSATPLLSLGCGSSSFRPNHIFGYGGLNAKAALVRVQ